MRTKLPILPMAVILCSEAFAGSPCPVDVVRAERYSNGSPAIEVEYRNVSNKAIMGISLGVLMYDSNRTMKPLFFELRDREEIAPGGRTEGTWTETMYHDEFPHVNVFVKKVKFTDSTEWKDDGTGRCNSGTKGIISKGQPILGTVPPQRHPLAAEVATADGHGEK